jgi:hypothetical protein
MECLICDTEKEMEISYRKLINEDGRKLRELYAYREKKNEG